MVEKTLANIGLSDEELKVMYNERGQLIRSYRCTKGHEWRGLTAPICGPNGQHLCPMCFQEFMAKNLGELYMS